MPSAWWTDIEPPYYLCDYRDGRVTMDLVGTFADAKPEDEVKYVKTSSYLEYERRIGIPTR